MDKMIAMRFGNITIVGFSCDLGRVEQLFTLTDDALAKRIVNAYNSTNELDDDTLQVMAEGGTKAGSLGERVVAWSIYWQASTHAANKFLMEARKYIRSKRGERI